MHMKCTNVNSLAAKYEMKTINKTKIITSFPSNKFFSNGSTIFMHIWKNMGEITVNISNIIVYSTSYKSTLALQVSHFLLSFADWFILLFV